MEPCVHHPYLTSVHCRCCAVAVYGMYWFSHWCILVLVFWCILRWNRGKFLSHRRQVQPHPTSNTSEYQIIYLVLLFTTLDFTVTGRREKTHGVGQSKFVVNPSLALLCSIAAGAGAATAYLTWSDTILSSRAIRRTSRAYSSSMNSARKSVRLPRLALARYSATTCTIAEGTAKVWRIGEVG